MDAQETSRQSEDATIVAYVVVEPGQRLDVKALRRHVSDWLPAHMVPSHFIPTRAIPLTPTGKVDVTALAGDPDETPASPADADPDRDPEPNPPLTPLEVRLRDECYAVALPGVRVSRDASFFQLGGTSIQAVRLIAAVRELTGTPVSVLDFLKAPTLGALSQLLRTPSRKGDMIMASPNPAPATTEPRWIWQRTPSGFPLACVSEAETPGQVRQWVGDHTDELHAAVRRDGAALLRGLLVRTYADVAEPGRELFQTLATPREYDVPHIDHGDGVYTLDDGPSADPVCPHNRQSHALEHPSVLMIACLHEPRSGGDIVLCDSRTIDEALPADLRGRLRQSGWILDRNFNPYLGLSWQEAFATESGPEVEHYCRQNAIAWAWTADGGLRTTQRRPAFRRHPGTGEDCWFNTILYFNKWSNEAGVRALLIETFGADGLPFDTRLGDGRPMDREHAAALDLAYRKAAVRQELRAGDVLLLDNLRMAYGREPFHGIRELAHVFGGPMSTEPTGVTDLPPELTAWAGSTGTMPGRDR